MKCQLVFGLVLALAFPLFAQHAESNRVENAGKVMEQILDAPERIPQEVLDQAGHRRE